MMFTGFSTEIGDRMEFRKYDGEIGDLESLHAYLRSVTILINQIKNKYGV